MLPALILSSLGGWPTDYLGSCPWCVEACEAWGSTIVFQRPLCINQMNRGRAFPVGQHSCDVVENAISLCYLLLFVLLLWTADFFFFFFSKKIKREFEVLGIHLFDDLYCSPVVDKNHLNHIFQALPLNWTYKVPEIQNTFGKASSHWDRPRPIQSIGEMFVCPSPSLTVLNGFLLILRQRLNWCYLFRSKSLEVEVVLVLLPKVKVWCG